MSKISVTAVSCVVVQNYFNNWSSAGVWCNNDISYYLSHCYSI